MSYAQKNKAVKQVDPLIVLTSAYLPYFNIMIASELQKKHTKHHSVLNQLFKPLKEVL